MMARHVLLAFALIPTTTVASAAQTATVAGAYCGAGGICASFNAVIDPPEPVRSIVFTAPADGTLTVSVAGTMECAYSSPPGAPGAPGVIDVFAQIVRGNAVPSAGSGSQRFRMEFPGGSRTSHAVTLAATRVLSVSAGDNTFRYRMVANRVDLGAGCTIWGAQMFAQFIPS